MVSQDHQQGFYRKLFDLSGRVAVVTGGVGILGRRFCAGLADFGAKVAVVDRDQRTVEDFAEFLTDTYGVQCMGIEADVSREDDVLALTAQVEQNMGPVDILHNNAATKGKDLNRFFDSVSDFEIDTWKAVMAVNIDGAFLVAREIGTRMAERRRGSIIQTASIYGIMGPDQRIYEGSEYMGRAINTPAVYSASKAAIIGLTKYLATYWGHYGVRVNSLTPGGVSSGQNEIFEKRYSARIPMSRMAKSDEIVGALIYLASDASSYVTGQNIVIDGGLSAW
jgi:NAD(P)-dependent dehydrogenase (short-subunit alcohol dehydrogenase family)